MIKAVLGCFLFVCLVIGFRLVVSMDEKVEQRTIIKFLVQSGHTPIQCWRKMRDVFGTGTVSKNCVRVWHKRFLNGETSVKDKKRPGRPRSVRTDEAVQKVNQLLGQDRRQTVRDMADQLSISKTTLHTILKKEMKLSKLCPKFVPKVLTQEQKDFRVRLCEMNLQLLKDHEDFLERVITGDESWVSVFEIECKGDSSQ